MNTIHQNLNQFIEALKKGESVRINHSGEWFSEGFLVRGVRTFLGLGENKRLVELAANFAKILDSFEKFPIRFGTEQTIDFASYLLAAQEIIGQLQKSENAKVTRAKNQLLRRVVALLYRLEGCNGGWDKEKVQMQHFHDLIKVATEWKNEQGIFYTKELSVQEVEKLEETAQFPRFAEILLQDEDIRDTFLRFALRDRNDVIPFIQFPGTQEKLSRSNLQNRIGRMGSKFLKIIKKPIHGVKGILEKILTLPFEGKENNILDEEQVVTFRGNYNLTIAEVFKIFESKNKEVGNLEFLKEGIINWNVHKLGWWNADKGQFEVISMTDKEWWKKLPLFEVISKKEAQMRYGRHMDGLNWNAAATSTRGSPTLDFDQSHAYLEMAIPLDNQHYAIYDFGKFAIQFPSTFFEGLSMFCHTVHATVAYPDENVFYSHRQHAQHSFPLTWRQGLQLLDSIRHDLIKARAHNFVYQIESENCAKWLHEKLDGVVGNLNNLFKMHLLDSEPFGPVAIIFELIRWLPKSVQVPILTALHLPLGAAKETWVFENGEFVRKSLNTHEFWETGIVYLPAFLHKQIENGVLGVAAAVAMVKEVVRYGAEWAKESVKGFCKPFVVIKNNMIVNQNNPLYEKSHVEFSVYSYSLTPLS